MKFPISCLFLIATLFILSSFTVSPEHKKIYQIRMAIPFITGTPDEEVYLFTDWNNPKSSEVESQIEKISPDILKEARLYFVDIPSEGMETYTKSNLKFLINPNKTLADYFTFRKSLWEKAKAKTALTDQNTPVAIKDSPIPQDAIETGMQVFKMTSNNLKATNSPTVVVYNLTTHKSTRLEGANQITSKNILEALSALKTPPK